MFIQNLLIFSSILSLLVGGIVWWTKNIRIRDKLFFLGFVTGAFIWGGGILLNFRYPAGIIYSYGDIPYITMQVLFFGAALMISSQYWFFSIYRNQKFSISKNHYISLLLFLIFMILLLMKDTIFGNIKFSPERYTILENGQYVHFFVVYVLFFYFSSLFTLLKRIAVEKGVYKKQLQFLFFSFLFFNTSAIVTNLFLPTYFNIPEFNLIGPVFYIIEASVFFYTTTKLRFLDIQLTAQKYLTYVTNISLYMIPFIALVHNATSFSALIRVMLYALYAILIVVFWKDTFCILNGFWNYVFYRKKDNPLEKIKGTTQAFQTSLDQGLSVLSKSLGVGKAIFATPDQLGTNLSQFFSSYPTKELVRDELEFKLDGEKQDKKLKKVKSELEKYMIAAAFPVIGKNKELLGVILLEQKMDGNPFSAQEIQETKHMLREATIYLAKEKDYEQIRKRLKNTHVVPKEFLTNLMHEVSHPLMMARNIDQMIEWQRLKPEDQQFIKSSQEDLQALSKKLDRLSYAFQWQAGMLSVQKSIGLLEDSIRFAIEDLQAEIPEIKKWASVYTDISLKGKTYYFDSYLLKEAFREIIKNAFFFQNRKKKKLKVTLHQERSNNIILDFIDEGMGIAKEHWEDIFQIMHVLAYSRNESESGLGVGLTITRGIIEAHGGNIEIIKSQVNKGTTFRVQLPLETYTENNL